MLGHWFCVDGSELDVPLPPGASTSSSSPFSSSESYNASTVPYWAVTITLPQQEFRVIYGSPAGSASGTAAVAAPSQLPSLVLIPSVGTRSKALPTSINLRVHSATFLACDHDHANGPVLTRLFGVDKEHGDPFIGETAPIERRDILELTAATTYQSVHWQLTLTLESIVNATATIEITVDGRTTRKRLALTKTKAMAGTMRAQHQVLQAVALLSEM